MKLKAFTLIELLVVIGIITILSGAIITLVNPASKRQDARDAVRKSDLAVISSALESYYADNYTYPSASSINCLYDILDGSTDSDSTCPDPAIGAKIYLNTKPADPSGAPSLYCYSRPTAQRYNLCAKLERGAAQLNGATSCSPAGSGTGGAFCITNPF